MNVNTDINVLGSILDFNLINNIINSGENNTPEGTFDRSYTKIKTTKSLKRYELAINKVYWIVNTEILLSHHSFIDRI